MRTSAFPSVLPTAFRPLLLTALIASLSACGGGGGGDAGEDGGNAVPQPVTLTGMVAIDQAVSNAMVCVDLNGDGICDAGEPVSVATGLDGKYTVTYQPADAAAAAAFQTAPVLASITPQSVDGAQPGSGATASAFVLSAPAGKAGQISPLTTLVQNTVAKGATLAAAENAVAQQLGIAVAALYDYQGDPASSSMVLPDTARTAAKVAAYALELGAPVVVTPSGDAAAASTALSLLNYTDAENYSYRVRQSDGVLNAAGYTQQFETRAAKTAGSALDNAALFPSVTLTADGWLRCDGSVPRLRTRGNPERTLVCGQSSTYLGFVVDTQDVAGKPMADVATSIQEGDSKLNAEGIRRETSVNLAPAKLGVATFPKGSTLSTSVSVQLGNAPLFINHTVNDRFGFPSLQRMISVRSVSGVNLATAAATTVGGLGLVDATRVLRAAFVDGSTIQFYACEATAPNYADPRNCTAHSQSSFTIETAGGVPLLKFATFPGAAAQNGMSRGYTEYDGVVYPFRQPAAIASEDQAVTYNQRLNGPAWAAMRGALGLN